MSYDYSENILVQESVGHFLERELEWEVAFAYNTEQLGKDGTFAGQATGQSCSPGIFGRPSSGSIRGSPPPSWTRPRRRWKAASPPHP